MTSRYSSELPTAKDWTKYIRDQLLDCADVDWASSCKLEAIIPGDDEPLDLFSGTLAQYVESLQADFASVYRMGQREAFEFLIAQGETVLCPVCLKPINQITGRQLHDEILMCWECFYK